MKKYAVTLSVDATITIEVEAGSPEEAKEKALDQAETPSLCHYCANELCIGDIVDDRSWVESI